MWPLTKRYRTWRSQLRKSEGVVPQPAPVGPSARLRRALSDGREAGLAFFCSALEIEPGRGSLIATLREKYLQAESW
jgi:hypothetical protein